MTDFYALILGSLVTWRLTHLLNAEDGPWDSMKRLRSAMGSGFLGSLFDCFYCLSLWIAIPLAWLLSDDLVHGLLLWPALSAGAILLERLSGRRGAPAAPYVEGPYFDSPDVRGPEIQGSSIEVDIEGDKP